MPNFKVAIIKTTNYSESEKSLLRAFDLLGGAQKFFKPTQRVLLKPNLLRPAAPETAATTHPEIIKALINIIKSFNANVIIGDSPGSSSAETVLKKLDLLDFLKKNNIKIYDAFDSVDISKKIADRQIKFKVSRAAVETDFIISAAKLKTHGQMIYTGAIKNLFGLVPGALKPELHFKLPDNQKFAQMIVDLFEIFTPNLAIIDAIVAMEGNGPGSGNPKKLNALIVSENALAADICALKIIDQPLNEVPIINQAIQRKLGPTVFEEIDLLGDSIDTFIDKSFQKIKNPFKITRFLPTGIASFLLKNLLLSKPLINRKLCIRCGKCVKICHSRANALTTAGLVFDYKKCIRCYCCQEICPVGAITIYHPPAQKIIDFIISQR